MILQFLLGLTCRRTPNFSPFCKISVHFTKNVLTNHNCPDKLYLFRFHFFDKKNCTIPENMILLRQTDIINNEDAGHAKDISSINKPEIL